MYIIYGVKNKALVNLVNTQEMEMLMEHLFTQDLGQLLYFLKEQIVQVIGSY